MKEEQQIRVGQTWKRRKTGRLVRITAYNKEWDDARYRWVEGKGGGSTYGCYLRRGYDLVKDPKSSPIAVVRKSR